MFDKKEDQKKPAAAGAKTPPAAAAAAAPPRPAVTLRYLDRPDCLETFADSISGLSFDGQTLRLEFAVTRMDDVKPDAPATSTFTGPPSLPVVKPAFCGQADRPVTRTYPAYPASLVSYTRPPGGP